MDSNGLADPYVKLHLLPGASKVLRPWLLHGLSSEPEAPTPSHDGHSPHSGSEGQRPQDKTLEGSSFQRPRGSNHTHADMFVGPSAGSFCLPLS